MDHEPLEELSESECWTLLRTVDVGRLAAPNRRGGVDIFPVNHVVDQGSIVFRTAAGTKVTDAVEAPEVAFEADNAARSFDEQLDDPWSVVVHGVAELITIQTDLFDSFELSVRPVARLQQAVLHPPGADSGVRSPVPHESAHMTSSSDTQRKETP